MSQNCQLFALRQAPPETVHVQGCRYELVRVLKHDFYAATCLYRTAACRYPRIIVKYYRMQEFAGIDLEWAGRQMCARELSVYRRLSGLRGIPRALGRVGPASLAIEYIESKSLDRVDSVPNGFFDKLVELMQEVHHRGIAYVDTNKRSNILLDTAGDPWLVDFQISLTGRTDFPPPLRQFSYMLVKYFQKYDWYHLYKHKRKLAPEELTAEEEEKSYYRTRLHKIHRKIAGPWRKFRRGILRRQFRQGRLVSPTEAIEDVDLPEKCHWRTKKDGPQ